MRKLDHIGLARFARNQQGTTMIEFAISVSLFLLIFFAVLDFGRLAYNWVMAEKAMQRAARIAAVRPPICPGVPRANERPSGPVLADFIHPAGTKCSLEAGLCRAVEPVRCTLNSVSSGDVEALATASEIWTAVLPMLPDNATSRNVLLRYEYDERLGFLGGPYTPVITAELVGDATDGDFDDFCFSFVTPLSALAAASGAAANIDENCNDDANPTIPFPDVSASIPAEDMNLGGRG